jgi:hypothetical protein
MFRADAPSHPPDRFIGGHGFEPAGGQPIELFGDLVEPPAPQTHEDVDHLGQVYRVQERAIVRVTQDGRDRGRGRFADQQCDDRLCVENAQVRLRRSFLGCRTSARDSSARSVARASSVDSPTPASEPIAAPIGSDGIGRMMSSLPRSSTESRDVCHRRRTSAGMEIWPPREIIACFMMNDDIT